MDHLEGVSCDSSPPVESELVTGSETRYRRCLDRAFGTVALGEGAQTDVLADALDIIRDAEGTRTYNARTRATIYRCNSSTCSYAILSFTIAGTPPIPDASALRLERLPGARDCVLLHESATPPQDP